MTDFDPKPSAQWSTGLTLDERGGPAARVSRERALAMIDRALDEALLPPTTASTRAEGRSRSRSFAWLASAAALLLALAGSAFAALHYWGAASRPATKAAPAVARRAVAPPPSAAAPSAEPAPAVEPALLEPPAAARAPDHAARAEPPARAEPEDLLQAANHLRAQGRFDAAAEVYALVYERYPGSISAYTAQVARATIELEHRSNPRLARALFTRALRSQPQGALDIEVRQGLALALHDLGDAAAEAQALRALIANLAESPAAERARARLHELEAAAR